MLWEQACTLRGSRVPAGLGDVTAWEGKALASRVQIASRWQTWATASSLFKVSRSE